MAGKFEFPEEIEVTGGARQLITHLLRVRATVTWPLCPLVLSTRPSAVLERGPSRAVGTFFEQLCPRQDRLTNPREHRLYTQLGLASPRLSGIVSTRAPLQVDPATRLTATQVVEHPWVNNR